MRAPVLNRHNETVNADHYKSYETLIPSPCQLLHCGTLCEEVKFNLHLLDRLSCWAISPPVWAYLLLGTEVVTFISIRLDFLRFHFLRWSFLCLWLSFKRIIYAASDINSFGKRISLRYQAVRQTLKFGATGILSNSAPMSSRDVKLRYKQCLQNCGNATPNVRMRHSDSLGQVFCGCPIPRYRNRRWCRRGYKLSL